MSSRNAPLGIVVGIDDSPAARVAVQWATHDAELRNVPLTLVHAISPEVSTWLKTPPPAGVMRWQQDHGRRLIDEGSSSSKRFPSAAVPPACTPKSWRREPSPR